jgi:predicted secreted acid phosphatase
MRARPAGLALAAALALGAATAAAPASEPPAPATPEEIEAYRSSGEWEADLTAQIERAKAYLADRIDDRAAIVLDIDDTSLSNYDCLKAVDFDRAAADCADLPAIPQTLRLYRYARAHDVRVFFITGRRERAREDTVDNLKAEGYTRWKGLRMRPDDQPASRRDGWKARTRRAIERRGYRIVVNLGDQRSDLDGGHALRRFKLPNPMYVIETA